jgi:hypothetical protein
MAILRRKVFSPDSSLNLIANDYGEILVKKKIKNPCGGVGK